MNIDDSITVIRRRVKHVRLRVKENGELVVTVPWWISPGRIAEIVRRKTPWIERLRAHFRANILRGALFRSDEVMLFGEPFKVVSDSSRGCRVDVDQQSKTIRTSRDLSSPVRRSNWQRTYAKTFLIQRLRELGQQHGLVYNRVSIRAQRTRWGSCSARKNISLNWRLILAPAQVIDYVLLHELMHTRILNHSREFWAQLSALCPDYRQAKAWLKSSHKPCL